jgi:hypothetical protein
VNRKFRETRCVRFSAFIVYNAHLTGEIVMNMNIYREIIFQFSKQRCHKEQA